MFSPIPNRAFLITSALATLLLLTAQTSAKTTDDAEQVANDTLALLAPGADPAGALKRLVLRGNKDVIPSLVLAMRYSRYPELLGYAISKLTAEEITNWNEAMLWQENHPEIKPHPSFKDLKLSLFSTIDPQFMRFLGAERTDTKNMRIRLEEIAWGGVRVDGIPSLDNPELIKATEADYLKDDDLVFGVEINGDARAYPLRIMGWHEMFNETIGGVPVALAYCTLCGSGILFETKVEGRDKPFIFGSSGFLYRSNKLMFDRETDSLWNQFTGEPVVGPLVNSDIKLKVRPVVITSWREWKNQHKNTRVLSLKTGHRRNYGSGVVYKEYFSSPNLMFPAHVRDETLLKRKDYVFGIRDVGVAKAWPLGAFKETPVINDNIGEKNIVLLGDASTRTVRAYERKSVTFNSSSDVRSLASAEGTWKVQENAIIGPKGQKLARIPGHIAYWFAWDGFMGLKSELYKEARN